MPYQSIATTLVFVRLRWLTCTVCCCLKSLRGLAFLRWQGHERPGCKVKGKSGSPNTPPAVSSPSTGTNSICMVNGLTYGSHRSKKVVLPIRKMARKVLGGACIRSAPRWWRVGGIEGAPALWDSAPPPGFTFSWASAFPRGWHGLLSLGGQLGVRRGKCFHGGGGHQLGTTHEWWCRLGAVPGLPLTWCTPKQQPKWSK